MAQHDRNCNSAYGGELTDFGQSLLQYDNESVHEPNVGIEFLSEDAARMFYEEYARCSGFSIRFGHLNQSKHNGKVASTEFLCSSSGMDKKNTERCGAMLKIELSGENKWIVTKFVKEHNHPVVNPSKLHSLKPVQPFTCPINNVPETCQGVEVVPSGVMYMSVDENHVPSESNGIGKNIPVPQSNIARYNNLRAVGHTPINTSRKRTFGRDAQNLLDYFKRMQAENPGFYYAIQLDEENRMANAFWADARSRTAYSHFGDAVVLDTMYRINQSRVPFVPFTGVNHHAQTILFGCALLLDESEATFVWLLKTFLAAMSDRAPVSLTTDNDRLLQTAVGQVFPKVRHCVSKWHILREGQERMARVCLAHPSFQVELCNCINTTRTIEEFESCWESILDKYDLRSNDWLQSIYDARRQWVPVYFRDSFFATITPSLGTEGSFFNGYVNQQTTLPSFFRQYERALENSFEREAEADSETKCTTPVLRTPSPMEKQAANLYTKIIFSKFQEELVETFVYTANRISGDGINSTFRVAKFEDDNKAYNVSLNTAEMKASCSCQMFEYSGILCRHILTVFTVTNILTLPSHYILKRWTQNAKSVSLYDERSEQQSHGSVTTRYNNICKEAIRFSEEAAITSETYSAALVSLKEAWKKIAGVKESAVKVLPSSSQRNGVGYGDGKTSTETPETIPLLWPQQGEICRFNLNDNGLPSHPISNFNIPRMAPVSVNDSRHDNMVVLPCLKSMTWGMENKELAPVYRIAVINLKLQDNSRTPVVESEVKFSLSKVTLEPMLKSMAYISEQLSAPANKVAVINLKLQDSETTSGESEVKFQVSRDTLGALLRSMAYIREQLSCVGWSSEIIKLQWQYGHITTARSPIEPRQESRAKKQRK